MNLNWFFSRFIFTIRYNFPDIMELLFIIN